jgi:hypothetical protein
MNAVSEARAARAGAGILGVICSIVAHAVMPAQRERAVARAYACRLEPMSTAVPAVTIVPTIKNAVRENAGTFKVTVITVVRVVTNVPEARNASLAFAFVRRRCPGTAGEPVGT